MNRGGPNARRVVRIAAQAQPYLAQPVQAAAKRLVVADYWGDEACTDRLRK